MRKTFKPEKYNMAICPACNGKGKLPKNSGGFDVCKECGGFGAIKKTLKLRKGVKPLVE
jgi:DnaJ-class molecular chaperone